MNQQPSITAEELFNAAAREGLHVVGVLSASSVTKLLAGERGRLKAWQDAGRAGEMSYMLRDPELLTNPAKLLPEFASVISFVIPYCSPDELPASRAHCAQGFGRVARYAWGRDYHRVIPKRLRRMVVDIARGLGGPAIAWRVFSDAVPLLERALGAGAGCGFVGKNTMFIRPGLGSYSFLAEVVWDLQIADVPPTASLKSSCGSCRRCLDVCPTNALPAAFELDARRCISYLTIEKRGCFNEWQAEALGEWLFGCDLCQAVCPFNHQGVSADPFSEFSATEGCGPQLKLNELFALRSREAFLKRFAGTPLMRAGREGLLRNAAAVAANTRSFECIDSLILCLEEDPSTIVRGQAGAALRRMESEATGIERSRISSTLGRLAVVLEKDADR